MFDVYKKIPHMRDLIFLYSGRLFLNFLFCGKHELLCYKTLCRLVRVPREFLWTD